MAHARLSIMRCCHDGFRIAEEDLQIRGAGEFAGTKQAGGSDLWIADLVRDIDIYRQARTAAQELLATDPALRSAPNASLRRALEGQPSTRAILLSS